MKFKIFILLAIILLLGIYFLWPKNENVKLKRIETVFINQSDISKDDLVVVVTRDTFEPASLRIEKGTRVIFLNASQVKVWPASNQHPSHTDYSDFDPQMPINPGEAWAFTFNQSGDWGYHDHLDPSKRGVVKVF